MTLDVVPLDASLVKGSHGLPAADPQDRPLFIGDGDGPAGERFPMTACATGCWRRLTCRNESEPALHDVGLVQAGLRPSRQA